MYLIDTNIIIWVLRGNPYYTSLLQKIKYKAAVSISAATIAEIYKNILPTETITTEELISKMLVWDVNGRIAKQAGLYWQQYIRRFKNIHIMDCLIAATAQEYNLTLLTLNTRHFPMNDISVFDPVKKLR